MHTDKETQRSKLWLVLAIALAGVIVASSALVAAVGYNAQSRANVDQRICLAVNRVNVTIEQTLKRSRKTLPTLSYYKEHPDELVKQEAVIRDEIRQFKPLDC